MTVALTAGLGAFVARLRFEDVPEPAVAIIKTGCTDCVGVMLAGATEPAPQTLRSVLMPAGGEARLFVGAGRASAPDAAWINATAAHALDFDDIALTGHPSASMAPALLAEAEAIGASGRQIICAYAAGYEVWAELVRREPGQHHLKGWHPSGIFGAVCAAAACASLRGLDADKSAMAIALGASQSAGLISNFGTMAKPFHVGRSAHAGAMAARLAERGFTASLDALEHAPGFLVAVSPSGQPDVESPIRAGIDGSLQRLGLSIKQYPSCGYAHRALDGMLDLIRTSGIKADEVKRVTVSTGCRGAAVLRNHAPLTGLAAKFSMEFAMATALIAHRAGLAEHSDAFVMRADVQALMKRVEICIEDRQDAKGYAIYDRVVIETVDGRQLDSGPITKVRGGPELPLRREELWTKFEGCIEVSGVRCSARALFDALMSLERIEYVRELWAALPIDSMSSI
jgi:2-methylcitrate dehydratase PrpD